MKRTGFLLALALLPAMAMAQGARLNLPEFAGLAEKARESVNIDLEGETLKSAGAFLGNGRAVNDPEFAEMIKGLQRIYLKVFSFEKAGEYSMRDIEPALNQVAGQGWKKLMSVRDGDERVEMWLYGSGADSGMFFVASEPKELVMINIVGNVNLAMLGKLQGRLGVPAMPGMLGAPPAPPAPPASPARAAPPAPAANSAPAAAAPRAL